jgi:hypothetical protein
VDLQLWLGQNVVGTAEAAFCSDFTWYGVFRPAPDMPPRVREFIAFCDDWHERLRAARPCSAAEFDPWAEIHGSPEWRACSQDGRARPVEGPVFIDGEVTWRGQPDAETGAPPDPAGM